MGAANYSVWIHARPEDVWRIYVDPSRIPDWQTGSPGDRGHQRRRRRARHDNPLEARTELTRLKTLVEREMKGA